ncbi:MAG: ATP-binding protein [Vulcanimicrobiaceae bacterium]
METTLRLLGHPALEHDGTAMRVGIRPKALALLGLLAAHHRRPVSRDWLARTLWADDAPPAGAANLRRHMHLLHKALGADILLLTRTTVQWNPQCGVSVDSIQFERCLSASPTEALAAYGGDFCEGVADESLDPIRERYRTAYESLLRSQIELLDTAGTSPGTLLPWLERLVALDPLDEGAVRRLMEALVAFGDRSAAIREYNALTNRLRAEIGAAPEPATVRLFESLLTTSQTPLVPNNLPQQRLSFVGRHRELSQLALQLAPGRIVSIVGPAGSGKSSLAVRHAQTQLARFPGGVWFADLTHVREERDAWERVRAAAAIESGPDPRERVVRALQAREALVILDRCEGSLDTARPLAERLAAAGVAVLTTTRRKLDAEGEAVLPLLSFDVPAADMPAASLIAYPAYRLFLERAAAAAPFFEISAANATVILELLNRVDGLPLGIEIIAARIAVLSPETILRQLRESRIPERLDAAIAWSYDLLVADQREVFLRLSIFRRTFTAEAAEFVCGAPIESALCDLVDASLLSATSDAQGIRYRLLDTIRAFAESRQTEREPLREMHARYYAGLAARYRPEFRSPREVEFFQRADADRENFDAALRWAMSSDPGLAAKLAQALCPYYIFRWNFAELEALARGLLSAGEDRLPLSSSAGLHLVAGLIAKAQTDREQAESHLQKALNGFRASGDSSGELEALNAIAIVAFNHGDPATLQLFEELLSLQRRYGDDYGATHTIFNIAASLTNEGQWERALALQLEGLSMFKRMKFTRGIGYAHRALSLSYAKLGRLDESVAAARTAVDIFESLGDRVWLADALNTLSLQLCECGKYGEALQFCVWALTLLSPEAYAIFVRGALLAGFEALTGLGRFREGVLAFGMAERLCELNDLAMTPSYSEYLQPIVETAKKAVGPATFIGLCGEAASMDYAELVDLIKRVEVAQRA